MATTTTLSPLTARRTTRIKERWDKLQGQEHGVDYERARLLHEVYERHEKDAAMLEEFIVAVLGEYPGKRTKMFVRFALAFETISDPEIWVMVGGKAVVLLSRTNKRNRRKTLTRVRRTLETTGRTTISRSTFRNILHEVLGENYRSVLTEPQSSRSNGNGAREQLRALKSFILTLMRSDTKLRKAMTPEVKAILGIDLVE